MELQEAKEKFIQSWGSLGSKWGINRTLAQIHALLLISPESLCSDDIMKELNISRGNVNMNIRTLIDWGLVRKEYKSGDRKEYFKAEQDIWLVLRKVISIRKQRELEPILTVMENLSQIDDKDNSEEVRQFKESINSIKNFAELTDKTLETIINSEENRFLSTIMKLMKK